jgi:hypothetical protein
MRDRPFNGDRKFSIEWPVTISTRQSSYTPLERAKEAEKLSDGPADHPLSSSLNFNTRAAASERYRERKYRDYLGLPIRSRYGRNE